jgi:hypothetical protein
MDNLNRMRHVIYCHLTSAATRAVLPERFSPAENTAKFNGLCTHLQVLQQKTLNVLQCRFRRVEMEED